MAVCPTTNIDYPPLPFESGFDGAILVRIGTTIYRSNPGQARRIAKAMTDLAAIQEDQDKARDEASQKDF